MNPAVWNPNSVSAARIRTRSGAPGSRLAAIVAHVAGAVVSLPLAVTFLQSRNDDGTEKNLEAPIKLAPSRVAGRIGLVVLPLANFSADNKDDYFAGGKLYDI